MSEAEWLPSRFEETFESHRPRLRAVAYRMLGSLTEADDAVQEAWLRLTRAPTDEVANPGAYLTTVVARVCLNLLRARRALREEPLDVRIPDPIVSPASGVLPEDEALLADSVGLALLVVLDTLTPAERLAFVLHDSFGVPFDEIAPMLDRTPAATRQLASRARRRVAAIPAPDPDLTRQRKAVDAFFAAARAGDFDALVAILHPEVTLRSDFAAGRRPGAARVFQGATDVANQARLGALPAAHLHPALINGTAGMLITVSGRPFALMAFTVVNGTIAAIDAIADPQRVQRIGAQVLNDEL